jgi:protein-disulfide isomerase
MLNLIFDIYIVLALLEHLKHFKTKTPMKRNSKKISLTILAIIIVIVATFFAYKNLFGNNDKNTATTNQESTQQSNQDNDKVTDGAKSLLEINANDIVLGDKNAPLTIVEYASLSCQHCSVFYSDGFPKLKEEYIATGKVKFIYRDYPLNQPALTAAMLALCQVKDKVADAEKYHNFIKVLFKTQESWAFSEDFALKLETIAKLDGISSEAFQGCIKNSTLQEQILKSRMTATQELQIQSTPTFFIGDEIVSGYGGYGDLKSVIEKKLSGSSAN